MKKIILIPGNTDLNRGDQALIWESIRLVRDLYGQVDISLVESGIQPDDIQRQKAQTAGLGHRFIKPILKHPGRINRFSARRSVRYRLADVCLWSWQAFADLCTSSLLLFKQPWLNALGRAFLSDEEKASLRRFVQADAVFVKGGGFIHSYGSFYDPYTAYYSLYLAMLSLRYGKPVYVLPNSIGPLKNCLARYLAKKVLSKCVFVSVRERLSEAFLHAELGIGSYASPDLGYYLKPLENPPCACLPDMVVPPGVKKIGITVRPYRFPGERAPLQKYEQYIRAVAGFVDSAVQQGYFAVFVAHTLGPSSHEDDRIAIRQVFRRVKNKACCGFVEDEQLDCRGLMALYACFDVLLATRFHSVIFAQTMNIPTLAISYGGHKGMGIMQDIGLADWVVPIEEVEAGELSRMMNDMMRRKEEYLAILNAYKLQLEAKREALMHALRLALPDQSGEGAIGSGGRADFPAAGRINKK